MKTTSFSRKLSCVLSAVALTATAVFPSILGATAHAFPTGAQVTSRSIQMSSSKQSDTPVTYNVSFLSGTAYTVKGIVVDFCAGSPIIGDATCVKPTGFNIPATPTVAPTAGISGGTWASGAVATNTNRTLKISDSTGNALSVGTPVTFSIAGITNTSTLGTFYARIVTYSDITAGTSDYANYASGVEGNSATTKDYGGIALSTANQLTVTAKVQESLVFCVYMTGTTCAASPTGTAVPLGDANGVLSNYATNYTNVAKFNVASNAAGGVVVNLKGENLCRVTSPCTNTDTANVIDPSGVACTADTAATGTEQFGLRVSALGAGVVTTGSNYGCAANNHTFNRAGTIGTYGELLAKTTAPGDEVVSSVEFMAKAATTTQAGIYTTTIGLIATGTY